MSEGTKRGTPSDISGAPISCPYCAGRKGRYTTVASRFTGTDYHMHEGPWETCWACEGTGEAPPTMRHTFSGDPWGPCTACGHPAYHEIHQVAA